MLALVSVYSSYVFNYIYKGNHEIQSYVQCWPVKDVKKMLEILQLHAHEGNGGDARAYNGTVKRERRLLPAVWKLKFEVLICDEKVLACLKNMIYEMCRFMKYS